MRTAAPARRGAAAEGPAAGCAATWAAPAWLPASPGGPFPACLRNSSCALPIPGCSSGPAPSYRTRPTRKSIVPRCTGERSHAGRRQRQVRACVHACAEKGAGGGWVSGARGAGSRGRCAARRRAHAPSSRWRPPGSAGDTTPSAGCVSSRSRRSRLLFPRSPRCHPLCETPDSALAASQTRGVAPGPHHTGWVNGVTLGRCDNCQVT